MHGEGGGGAVQMPRGIVKAKLENSSKLDSSKSYMKVRKVNREVFPIRFPLVTD